MLLYVDKKKQKRRQIKIASITLSCILILVANIICFKTALHQTNKSLTDYKTLQITQDWYKNADVIHLFSEKKQIKAILIPQIINRENVQTLALAFSKLSPSSNLIFTEDVPEKDYLQQISALFLPLSEDNIAPHNIIITTNINNITSLITKQKLFPQTLYYKQTTPMLNFPSLQKLLDQHFPPTPQPQNIQEQQLQAIKNFANTYRAELQNLFRTKDTSIDFINQNLILQNLGVCLSSSKQTTCSINPTCSFQQNIHTALANLKQQTPKTLYLLTKLEKIPVNTTLTNDEGMFFRFGAKEAFILPQKKQHIPNNTNIYAYLKQQAGLNPEHDSPDMKFYKFKTTEINIDDNI